MPRETSTVYYNLYISIKSKYNVNSWKKHSPGVGYPSSCNISLAVNNANLNELNGQASPLEAILEKQTNIGEVPTSIHRMKKKTHRARCGNNGEKSWPYGQHFSTCRARSGSEPKVKAPKATYWTNKHYLDVHSTRNLNKIIRNSLEITKLRLRILPSNMPILNCRI